MAVGYFYGMKKLLVTIITLTCISSSLPAQTVSVIKEIKTGGTVSQMVPQAGKGIWVISGEGARLFNPASKTYKAYPATTTQKKIGLIKHFLVQQDKVICATGTSIYTLTPDGLWKEIVRPPGQQNNPIMAMAMQGDDLLVADLNNINRLKGTQWLHPLQYIGTYERNAAPSQYFLYAAGPYYFYNKGSGIYYLDTAGGRAQQFSGVAAKDFVNEPGKGIWIKNYGNVTFIPQYIAGTPKLLTFSDYVLFNGNTGSKSIVPGTSLLLSEKGEAMLVSRDTSLVLSTTSSLLDNSEKITAVKSRLAPSPLQSNSPACIYNGSIYETSTGGLAKYTGAKKESLESVTVKSKSIEGYSRMMPDGKLYTRESNYVWIADGKNPLIKAGPFSGYVLDICSDGKDIYALSEDSLYKQVAPGKFKSTIRFENKVSAMAFDKKGDMWLGSHWGLTILSKGRQTFIRAAEIAGFPDKSFFSLLFAKDGTCYISMDYEYIYKDKRMTLISGSKGLGYSHFQDNAGNVYTAGIGDFFQYKGTAVTELKKMVAEKYPELEFPYVYSIAPDEKNRIWMLVSGKGKQGLMVIDKGEIVSFITENINVANPHSARLYFRKGGELVIADEKAGWTILKISG